MARLGSLLDAKMWEAMPNSSWTEAAQSRVFVLMSRIGCLVQQLLIHPHSLMPWQTLAILWDPEAAARITSMPRCLLDQLTLELVEAGGFGEMDSKMVVFAMCIAARTDISNLESLHAWVRKHIVARIQCPGMNIDDLGAYWVFGRNRSSLHENRETNQHVKKRPASQMSQDKHDEPSANKKPKKHKGNSWNLFCHRFCSGPDEGQRKDWSAASEAWNVLPKEEKKDLQNETKMAKAKTNLFGMEGGSIFGMKASTAIRQAAKAKAAAAASTNNEMQLQQCDHSLPPDNASAKQEVCPLEVSLEQLHSMAMAMERKGWGLKQANERQSLELISNWRKNQCSIEVRVYLKPF